MVQIAQNISGKQPGKILEDKSKDASTFGNGLPQLGIQHYWQRRRDDSSPVLAL